MTEGSVLFQGSTVDLAAIYRAAKVGPDELDRVTRAEQLLQHLPKKEAGTREVVEATFRAFGVDQNKIVAAAKQQLDALSAFIRYSHEQTQHVLDMNARRIAELEAEIERCKQASAEATHEGEERARTVNNELLKVESVLGFFGEDPVDAALDMTTVVMKTKDDPVAQRPTSRVPE